MKKTTLIWIVVAVLIIVVIGIVVSKNNQPVSNIGPIKIGFIGPLSGFGADWGEEMKGTVQIAVTEINDTGGIKGRSLNVVYEDGKCTGKDATTAAQKLINIDGVKIVLVMCGQEALPIAPIVEKAKILMMATWVTHPDLTGIGQYVFRNSYSDEDTGRMMAETINKKYRKVAVISESADYPIGLLNAFKKYFKGEVIEENYPPEAKDFRSYALDLISKKPEAVLVNPASPLGGLTALKQLRQLGYMGPLYGNYFGEVGDVLKAPEAQGMIFFTDPDVGDNAIKNQLFSKFETLYGRKPNFNFADAVTYDSVYVLKQAIENVGSDPSKIKDYLHNLKDFHGVMGTYGFNDKGDAVGYLPAVKVIKNGKILDVGN